MKGTLDKPEIVIIRGGTKPDDRSVSLASGGSVYHTLRKDHQVKDVHVTPVGNYELNGQRIDLSNFLHNFDGIVFHTLQGKDAARLQKICREADKPHTGNFHTHYTEASKLERKDILRKTSVKTIPYWRLAADYNAADVTLYASILNELRYPVVISPLPDVFSVDALVVNSEAELLEVLDTCFSLKSPVAVSDSYQGNLYAAVVMESFRDESPYVFPLYELLHTHNYANAYDQEDVTPRAAADFSISSDVSELAKSVFAELHLRDIVRVDILETPDDELFVLDVNPHPSLDRHSLVGDAVMQVGGTLSEVLNALVKQAHGRQRRNIVQSFKPEWAATYS